MSAEEKYGMWMGRNPQKIEDVVVGAVTTTYIGECPAPAEGSTVADTDAKWRIQRVVKDTTAKTTKVEYPNVAGKNPTGAHFQWSQRASYSWSFGA